VTENVRVRLNVVMPSGGCVSFGSQYAPDDAKWQEKMYVRGAARAFPSARWTWYGWGDSWGELSERSWHVQGRRDDWPGPLVVGTAGDLSAMWIMASEEQMEAAIADVVRGLVKYCGVNPDTGEHVGMLPH
jgi:hypothetical protein